MNTVTFRQYNLFNTVIVSYNNGTKKIKIEKKVKTYFLHLHICPKRWVLIKRKPVLQVNRCMLIRTDLKYLGNT